MDAKTMAMIISADADYSVSSRRAPYLQNLATGQSVARSSGRATKNVVNGYSEKFFPLGKHYKTRILHSWHSRILLFSFAG
jgi:hypothetical protein